MSAANDFIARHVPAAQSIDLPLGLVDGMPMADYLADPGVSNSMLRSLLDTPAHCFALHIAPDRPARTSTEAQELGTLAHCAVLEPGEFDARYVVLPDDAPPRPSVRQWNAKKPSASSVDAMEWWSEFNHRAAGRTVITGDEASGAQKQRDALLKVGKLRELLTAPDSVREVSAFWLDKGTRRRCRARPDNLVFHSAREVSVLDVKSVRSLTRDGIMRAVTEHGYHRSQVHNINGLRALGFKVRDFAFGFVSSAYPYLAAAFLIDEESIAQAEDEVGELMAQFDACSRSGNWPAFGDDYQSTGLAPWAKRRDDEGEFRYAAGTGDDAHSTQAGGVA